MKKLFITILILIVALNFTFCLPQNTDNTVAGKTIIDIPSSITGTEGTKEILQGTKDFVNQFFKYVRDEILVVNKWGGQLKTFITHLEDLKIFDKNESFTYNDTTTGDVAKWTPDPEAGVVFLLEWWKKQTSDQSLKKFMEIKFTEFNREGGTIVIAGTVIADITAGNYTGTASGLAKNPEMLKVTFDSDDGGKRYMKVELDEFQHTGLVSTTDYQECIIEVWKDTEGIVDIVGVTSMPGIKILNFDGTPTDGGAEELRYYIYTGRGTVDKATVNFALPLNTYTASNVFTTTENTIGGVIREYYADQLRYDYNGGHTILELLKTAGLLNYTTIDPVAEIPSTADIYTAIGIAHQNNPSNQEIENGYYLMSVSNPAYFSDAKYEGFGDGEFAPTNVSEYPSATSLPVFNIEKATVDGVTIAFEYPVTPPSK